MITTAIACSLIFGLQSTSTPAQLRAVRTAALAEKDPAKGKLMLGEVKSGLEKLISDDGVSSGADFRILASLIDSPNRFYEDMRVQYELYLTAARLGDDEAIKALPGAWDALVISLGRNCRLGFGRPKGFIAPGLYMVVPAPTSVLMFFRDPLKSRDTSKAAKDDPEVQKLVDADQKARDRDWSKMTVKDFEKLAKDDENRLKRIHQIVAKGILKTGNDYFNAALVCQHGSMFEDYALAHELSVCGMILGAKESDWLAAASYDRMLLNMGHRQRFGTQGYIIDGKTLFSPLDETMMNEFERKTLSHKTLKQIREKGFGN